MYRRVAGVGLALTMLVAGCGHSSSASQGPATSSTPVPSVATSSTRAASATSQAARDLPDPHTLRGLTEVPELPDPKPVEGSSAQKLPVTVTDVEGNKVTIKSTSRILALDLYGTLSRTLIGLGLGDKIVGRTVSSTEKQLHDRPVVTENGHVLNVEAVAGLKPSVIIADRSVGPKEALDQLRKSGIPVVLVDPHRSVGSTPQLIRTIANAVGKPDAGEALVKRTQEQINQAKKQIAAWKPAKPMRVAFLYVRGNAGVFFILGSENGASELIQGVGADDVASDKGITTLVPANAESLVSINPDAIFVMRDGLASTGGMKGLLARAGVANTTAGRKQRVISIPDGISLSFGPQTGEVLTAVAKALYGVK
jgi:iron complex transport system substrate-binding protein